MSNCLTQLLKSELLIQIHRENPSLNFRNMIRMDQITEKVFAKLCRICLKTGEHNIFDTPQLTIILNVITNLKVIIANTYFSGSGYSMLAIF